MGFKGRTSVAVGVVLLCVVPALADSLVILNVGIGAPKSRVWYASKKKPRKERIAVTDAVGTNTPGNKGATLPRARGWLNSVTRNHGTSSSSNALSCDGFRSITLTGWIDQGRERAKRPNENDFKGPILFSGSLEGADGAAEMGAAPEPAMLTLLGTGLIGLAALLRFRLRALARTAVISRQEPAARPYAALEGDDQFSV